MAENRRDGRGGLRNDCRWAIATLKAERSRGQDFEEMRLQRGGSKARGAPLKKALEQLRTRLEGARPRAPLSGLTVSPAVSRSGQHTGASQAAHRRSVIGVGLRKGARSRECWPDSADVQLNQPGK